MPKVPARTVIRRALLSAALVGLLWYRMSHAGGRTEAVDFLASTCLVVVLCTLAMHVGGRLVAHLLMWDTGRRVRNRWISEHPDAVLPARQSLADKDGSRPEDR